MSAVCRVQDLKFALGALGVETCYVVGVSGGGPYALAFAAFEPHTVLGVLLISAAGYPGVLHIHQCDVHLCSAGALTMHSADLLLCCCHTGPHYLSWTSEPQPRGACLGETLTDDNMGWPAAP